MNPAGLPAFSPLGLGITGPHSGLGASRRDTQTLIRQALELGVTLFDTGPAYGRGEAERRLGTALRGVPRDRTFVMTKAGIEPGGRRDFSAGAVEMSLRASLDRLQRDHIDLLWLHGPGPQEMTDKLLRRLEAFRERGMIRHIGMCGRGPELDHAIDLGAFDALMAPLNDQLNEAERARLARARAAGLAVVGIEVVGGTAGTLRWPRGRSDVWYMARRAKQRFFGRAPAAGAQSPREALAWALEQPHSDAVICLTTRAANLAANARLAGLEARPRTD